VILSAIVVALGGAVYLARHGGETASYEVFRGEPANLRSVGGIVQAMLALRGRAVIQFGLLLLIATPVLRVLFSWIAFLRQGDRLYAPVTLLVLVLLGYSLFGSS